VASAGAALGIHPFDQPDVQMAKDLAREAIAGKTTKKKPGDTDTISMESPDEVVRGIEGLLDKTRPGGYFAIQAYLEVKPRIREHLQAIRHKIRDRFKLATTVGFGPRFLHSTGQIHKGGPNTGVFLQLVDEPAEDLAVPDTDYTFGDVIAAQAMGDYQVVRQRDRRVLRVQLGKESERTLGILDAGLR
jgi:transaldolase/glucose-6-phosphate isomerase